MVEAAKELPAVCNKGERVGRRTRVLLVDDHPMIREGFRRLLEKDGEFEVVGEVEGVEDALHELSRNRVEMVLMDIQLPGLDGVEGTKLVKAKYPDVKVVIVSSYGEQYLVPAIGAGADGYLLKTQSPWELVKCMHQAALGQSPVDPSLTRHLMDHASKGRLAETDGMPTERQQEVLKLVSDGISSKEMATILHISETTLKREFRNIFNLLGVNDRAHAVAEACRRNLI
ncbi:MAG: response regulator transcription factor [Chloroflexi bacterium]|nr:response regulator transcription factor [Chloroflexota bacterium]